MTQNAALQLHTGDNVLVALRDLRAGERIEVAGHFYELTSDVPAKHKFVTADLAPGAAVQM